MKFTQRQLKNMVNEGIAIDVTRANNADVIPESYTKVGYSHGVNGCNGLLLQGKSGQLYAVVSRSTALFVF